MKKAVLLLGVFALLVAPAAHANVVEDFEKQVSVVVTELKERIADLEALTTIVKSDPAAMTAAATASFSEVSKLTPVPVPRVCELARRLARGAQGDDVKSLQDFLREQKVFTQDSTGYFGRLTEEALQKWQASQNIASTGDANSTGWGSVGPKTRALIVARWCGKPAPTPCSSEGPVCGMPTNYCPPNAKCIQIVPAPTTYPSECALLEARAKLLHKGTCTGTETSSDTGNSGSGTGSGWVKPQVCAAIYLPMCGMKGDVKKTYGNRCELDNSGATFVSTGECPAASSSGQGTGTGTPPPSNCPIVAFTPIVCATGQELKPTYNQSGCQTGYQCVSSTPSNCPIVAFTPIVCATGQELKPTYNQSGCQTGYQCVSNTPAPPKLGGGGAGTGGSSSIPTNCKVWFDGCNTCTRLGIAGSYAYACTLRACVDLEGNQSNVREPYCVQPI